MKAANLQLGSHVFGFSLIEHQDKLVKYYTGFGTGLMFMACFNFLKSSAKVMRTWKGSSTTQTFGSNAAASVGPSLGSV